MKNTREIVVIGSSNTDMTIRVERIPRAGETVLGGAFFRSAGGKGANQAIAASRAGGRVSFIARVGRDSFGDAAIAGFSKDKIDVTHVVRDPHAPSGAALILVARNGENLIAVASGANEKLSARDLRKACPHIGGESVLLMQLETPLETITAAAHIGRKKGALVILNPAPARSLTNELLRSISVLTPNETEAERLTGMSITGARSAAKAAQKLKRRGVRTVIVTLGAEGAFVDSPELTQLIPGFRVKAVDTTAAGDVFNGALAVALTENQPMDLAVRFANAAAALSVMRLGAQPSAPTRREIDQFLRGRVT